MKYFYHIFLLVAMLAVTAACSNDDYSTPESQSDLAIVKSTVNFGPGKSAGEIEFSSSRQVSVTSDSKWCVVTSDGNKVTVDVDAFNQIESRTAIVTLTDGYKTIRVPVHQDGFVLRVGKSLYVTGHEADEFDLKVTSNVELTVETSDGASSWLTLTKTSTGYHFKMSEAAKDRTASVYFKSGVGVADTVQVAQITTDGNYVAYYYGSNSSGQLVQYYAPVVLENDSLKGLDWDFACKTNADHTLSIPAGQSIGTWSKYYIFLVASSEDGYVTWNKSVTYSASPVLTKDGTFGYVFGDDGSWSGKKTNGLMAYAFGADTPSSSSMAGYLAEYLNLILIKQ